MESIMAFYKKSKHTSNQLKLKSSLSILIIGVFIFFGFASIEEDAPETKTLNNCDFLHTPVAVGHKFSFYAFDENLDYFPGLVITLVISEYDKMDDNGYCSLVLTNTYNKKITTNTFGEASFTFSKNYISNDDEAEVYFEPKLSGIYAEPGSFKINKTLTDIRNIIHVKKIEQFP